MLTAVKKAEDAKGLIFRVYEWAGKDATVEFHVPPGATGATVTNMMETPEGSPLAVDGRCGEGADSSLRNSDGAGGLSRRRTEGVGGLSGRIWRGVRCARICFWAEYFVREETNSTAGSSASPSPSRLRSGQGPVGTTTLYARSG